MARVLNEILAYSYMAAFVTGIVVLAAATSSVSECEPRSNFLRRGAWPLDVPELSFEDCELTWPGKGQRNDSGLTPSPSMGWWSFEGQTRLVVMHGLAGSAPATFRGEHE